MGVSTCITKGVYNVDRYDLRFNEWYAMPPMLLPRYALGAAIINRTLYVMGGIKFQDELSYAESFDQKGNAWIRLRPMLNARSYFASTALADDLYVFGGSQDPSAAENWNASTGSWTSLAPMPTIMRALEASCVQTGEICVMGWASDDYVVHVEIFQPWIDSWSTRTSMPIPSQVFSFVAYNSRLYILQGPGENTYVYDPRNSAPALHIFL